MSFPRVSPGDNVTLSANFLNAISDLLNQRKVPGAPALDRVFRPNTIQVKNDTGGYLPSGSVVGIGDPVNVDTGAIPTEDEMDFRYGAVIFSGEVPATGTHEGKFAILEYGLDSGDVGTAFVDGVVFAASVLVGSETDTTADITDGDTTQLTSGTAGTAQIIWKESGTGLKLAVMRLIGAAGGGGGGGSSDNPFFLPAGTDDVANTQTWDITQQESGYTGVEVEAWYRTYWGGDSSAVYGFHRIPTFDSLGNLVAVGAEIRSTLWSIGSCSTVSIPSPVITGGSCLITKVSSLTINWTMASGALSDEYGYRYRYGPQYGSMGSWVETDDAEVTLTGLTEQPYRIEIQQGYLDGLWGPSSYANITVDFTAPTTPTFTPGLYTVTNVLRPTWSWTGEGSVSGGAISDPPCASTRGNNNYEVELDSVSQGVYSYTLLTTPTWTPSVDLTEADHTLRVRERDAAGNWSAWASWTITVDVTPPTAPTVTLNDGQVTPTATSPIAWKWTAGGGGNGTFRVSLTGTGSWVETTDLTYSLEVTTSGTRTLYVQERDAAGNWSTSGSASIVVDVTAPSAPVMGAMTSPSTDPRPTWSWSSGGGGAGIYRHGLDITDLSGEPETSDTSWGPSVDLENGWHTVYVQERDALNNWSVLAGKSVLVTA